MIDYTYICVGKLPKSTYTLPTFSEPFALNIFILSSGVSDMETSENGQLGKSFARETQDTTSAKLAELLDDCSVELLQALLAMLLSRESASDQSADQ